MEKIIWPNTIEIIPENYFEFNAYNWILLIIWGVFFIYIYTSKQNNKLHEQASINKLYLGFGLNRIQFYPLLFLASVLAVFWSIGLTIFLFKSDGKSWPDIGGAILWLGLIIILFIGIIVLNFAFIIKYEKKNKDNIKHKYIKNIYIWIIIFIIIAIIKWPDIINEIETFILENKKSEIERYISKNDLDWCFEYVDKIKIKNVNLFNQKLNKETLKRTCKQKIAIKKEDLTVCNYNNLQVDLCYKESLLDIEKKYFDYQKGLDREKMLSFCKQTHNFKIQDTPSGGWWYLDKGFIKDDCIKRYASGVLFFRFIENDNSLTKKYINYQYVDTPNENLNLLLNQKIKNRIDIYKNESKENSLFVNTEVILNTDRLYILEFDEWLWKWVYNTYRFYIIFDKQNNKEIWLSDLFWKDTDYLNFLSTLSEEQITQQLSKEYIENKAKNYDLNTIKNIVSPHIQNYSNFYFDNTGFNFIFNLPSRDFFWALKSTFTYMDLDKFIDKDYLIKIFPEANLFNYNENDINSKTGDKKYIAFQNFESLNKFLKKIEPNSNGNVFYLDKKKYKINAINPGYGLFENILFFDLNQEIESRQIQLNFDKVSHLQCKDGEDLLINRFFKEKQNINKSTVDWGWSHEVQTFSCWDYFIIYMLSSGAGPEYFWPFFDWNLSIDECNQVNKNECYFVVGTKEKSQDICNLIELNDLKQRCLNIISNNDKINNCFIENNCCIQDSECVYIWPTGECNTPEFIEKVNEQNKKIGISPHHAQPREGVTCTCENNICITHG